MVSPIDRQQNILQLNIAERVQQVQQQHPEMQQRYFAIHLNQEKKKQLQKVMESEEMDRIKLKEDEHRKQQNNQQHPDEHHTDALSEERSDAQDECGHIDIKA
jgi:hypothetical protein